MKTQNRTWYNILTLSIGAVIDLETAPATALQASRGWREEEGNVSECVCVCMFSHYTFHYAQLSHSAMSYNMATSEPTR